MIRTTQQFTKGVMMTMAALAIGVSAHAKDSARPNDKDLKAQKEFSAAYIKAVNSKDPTQLKALIHPKTLQCVNEKNQDFFDEGLKSSFKHNIPETVQAKFSLQSRLEDMLPKALFTWPVKPEYAYRLEFTDPDVVKNECQGSRLKMKCGQVTLLRALAKEGGKYYEVQGCPTEKGVEAFKRARGVQETRAEKILALYRDMDKEMKADLTKKLEGGNALADVANYYEMKAKLSFFEAKEVVKLIQQERMR